MQTQTKGTSAPNPLWNKVGYALVPGSATVLDRTTSELADNASRSMHAPADANAARCHG